MRESRHRRDYKWERNGKNISHPFVRTASSIFIQSHTSSIYHFQSWRNWLPSENFPPSDSARIYRRRPYRQRKRKYNTLRFINIFFFATQPSNIWNTQSVFKKSKRQYFLNMRFWTSWSGMVFSTVRNIWEDNGWPERKEAQASGACI
jgi:hypothetical protein